jgi:hypothetical protein
MRVETEENSFEKRIKLFDFDDLHANTYLNNVLTIYPSQAYGTTMVKKSNYYLITMFKSSD